MSFAIKYRPKNFNEVLGQGAAIKSLKAALARPVVAHSWLFVGPPGCGKTTLARLLGAHFAGGSPSPANVIEIDAATNSGADAMRDVASRAHFKAVASSPVKTIIADEVHRLSAAAWSSLLKPIEEPPEHVFWVLCTTEVGKIPETIKTRCVSYTLKPVDEVLIYELLKKVSKLENLTTSEEVLEAIAERCGGSPRQALVDLELCAHAKTANEARALMQSVLQQKGPIELAKLLIGKVKPSWPQIMKLITSIENSDAETIRIVVTNYITGAIIRAKGNEEAARFLYILECFSKPYAPSDKMAPLVLSIGLALGLNQ